VGGGGVVFFVLFFVGGEGGLGGWDFTLWGGGFGVFLGGRQKKIPTPKPPPKKKNCWGGGGGGFFTQKKTQKKKTKTKNKKKKKKRVWFVFFFFFFPSSFRGRHPVSYFFPFSPAPPSSKRECPPFLAVYEVGPPFLPSFRIQKEELLILLWDFDEIPSQFIVPRLT